MFSVLHDACNDGDLSVAEAIEAAQDIFAVNAIQFYKLHLDHKPVSSKSSQVVVTGNTTNGDTLLVRVIWIDASGQHRCRVSVVIPVSLSPMCITGIPHLIKIPYYPGSLS